jgi:hypothetical protein
MEKNYFSLHPGQKGIYFDQLSDPGSTRYNIGGYHILKGEINIANEI